MDKIVVLVTLFKVVVVVSMEMKMDNEINNSTSNTNKEPMQSMTNNQSSNTMDHNKLNNEMPNHNMMNMDSNNMKNSNSMMMGHHMGHSSSFNNNLPQTYLFKNFIIDSNFRLLIFSLITILIGILIEYIKFYRCTKLTVKPNEDYKKKLSKHKLQTVFYFLQALFGYLLMLIAMTFNYFLFTSTILGLAIGYLIFQKPVKNEDGCCDETSSSRLNPIKEHMALSDACC